MRYFLFDDTKVEGMENLNLAIGQEVIFFEKKFLENTEGSLSQLFENAIM
jgi:hypothetical protein